MTTWLNGKEGIDGEPTAVEKLTAMLALPEPVHSDGYPDSDGIRQREYEKSQLAYVAIVELSRENAALKAWIAEHEKLLHCF